MHFESRSEHREAIGWGKAATPAAVLAEMIRKEGCPSQ